MRKSFTAFLIVTIFPIMLWAQTETEKSSFHSPDFNWDIDIPPGYEEIEPAVWDLQKGIPDSIAADSLGIETPPRTILAFKNNDYNYFESNWQPYDVNKQGDYKSHCQSVDNQLYQTFAEQIPDAKIDTASSVQQIGKLDFQKFVLKMTLPNGVTLSSHMFSRLFDDKEFSANLFYVNDEQGSLLMEAWLYSRFE